MTQEREVIKAIASVLKKHFSNLSVEKVLDISIEILNAIDALIEKEKT